MVHMRLILSQCICVGARDAPPSIEVSETCEDLHFTEHKRVCSWHCKFYLRSLLVAPDSLDGCDVPQVPAHHKLHNNVTQWQNDTPSTLTRTPESLLP